MNVMRQTALVFSEIRNSYSRQFIYIYILDKQNYPEQILEHGLQQAISLDKSLTSHG